MNIKLIPAKTEDAKLIYEGWGSNQLNYSYLSAKPMKGIHDATQYLEEVLEKNGLAFHVSKKEGGVIGVVKAKIDGHRALIGYVIDQKHWGNGYATDAVREFLTIIKPMSGVQRIWATCSDVNIGSTRVLGKCGFKREGILKNWIIYPVQGKMAHDNYSYSLQGNA